MSPRAWLLLCALAGAGCKSASGNDSGIVRDSAGVAIVDNAVPADRDRPRYVVDSAPSLDLGGGESPNVEFGDDVVPWLLSDGRLAVASPRDGQLRFFDTTGRWIRNVGRRGEGPDEFMAMVPLGLLAGDSVAVFDFGRQRLTVFDSSGKSARISSWVGEGRGDAAGGGPKMPRAIFPDGRVLMGSGHFPNLGDRASLWRDTLALVVLDSAAGASTTVGQFPGDEMALPGKAGLSTVKREMAATTFAIPVVGISGPSSGGRDGSLFRAGFFVPIDTLLVVGNNAAFGFDLYGRRGNLIRRVRRSFEPAPITPADVATSIDQRLAQLPPQMEPMKKSMRARFESEPHPEFKPAYDQLLTSSAGEIWVREFDPSPIGSRSGRYSVFDRNGRWLATVATPRGFTPTSIGRDRMVGTWRDQDEVVHIRVHRIKGS